MTAHKPPSGDKPTAAYDVGYGKPPVHSRFKPGETGNKQGRPKGQPTFVETLAQEAVRHLTMTTPKGKVTITKNEALARRLFQSALAGDIAAARLILFALAQHASGAPGALPDDENADNAASALPDDETVRRMLARFKHLRKDPGASDDD